MERKNKGLISEAAFIFVMFLAGFISFFVLPDTIAVQWNGLEASSYKTLCITCKIKTVSK